MARLESISAACPVCSERIECPASATAPRGDHATVTVDTDPLRHHLTECIAANAAGSSSSSSSSSVSFAVAGTPRPQGNKTLGRARGSGRPVILEGRDAGQRARFYAWRGAVTDAAHDALKAAGRIGPFVGPVRVELLFLHKRPQRTPAGHRWRSATPDADKLARAALDALKAAGVVGDDGQVAELVVRKVLALPDENVGLVGTVSPLDHAHAPESAAEHLPAPTDPDSPANAVPRPQRPRSHR